LIINQFAANDSPIVVKPLDLLGISPHRPTRGWAVGGPSWRRSAVREFCPWTPPTPLPPDLSLYASVSCWSPFVFLCLISVCVAAITAAKRMVRLSRQRRRATVRVFLAAMMTT